MINVLLTCIRHYVKFMPRILYVSSGMINNTEAAGTCLLALLIVIHIKCLTLFNSNEVLISTLNAGTYL